MKLWAKDLKIRAKIRDLDTHRDVRGVIWVDQEAGLCEAYQLDAQGSKVLTMDEDGMAAWKTVTLKGRFKLIPMPEEEAKLDRLATRVIDKIKMGAPTCAKCSSPLTLRGDDLCVHCRVKERGKPLVAVKARRLGPLDFQKCDGCSRDATWSSSDEVVATPQHGKVVGGTSVKGGAYLFDRAATVGRSYWCAWCYRGPRTLDDKGEVVSVDEGGGPDSQK